MSKPIAKYVKIVTYVPSDDADAVRKAMGDAGAGKIGDYTYCSWSTTGVGRFLPGKNADPAIGMPGKHETVQEERIEMPCERKLVKKVLAAMRNVHPYEEVAFDIYETISEDDV